MTMVYRANCGRLYVQDGEHFEELKEATAEKDLEFADKIFAGKLTRGDVTNGRQELFEACKYAYLRLLRSTGSFRINSQFELCRLRDAIAAATNKGSQETQEKYEDVALTQEMDGVR